jgi:hypothetical protein
MVFVDRIEISKKVTIFKNTFPRDLTKNPGIFEKRKKDLEVGSWKNSNSPGDRKTATERR